MAERTAISIYLDLNEKDAIPKLELQAEKLRKTINGVEKGTKEFDLALKKLKDGEENIKRLNSEIETFEKLLSETSNEADKAKIEKSIRNLRAELAKTTQETIVFAQKINGLDRNSKEYAQTVEKLNKTEERLNIARLKATGTYSSSLKDLKKIINAVEQDLFEMSREQEGFAEKQALLQKIKNEYRALKNEIDGINPALEKQKSYWQWFKVTFASTFLSEIASSVFQNVFGSIQNFVSGTVQNAAQLDDALAKANKGLDVGVETLKMLKNELKQLDTRTPLEELIKMMEILGNAGVPAKEVAEGVKEINNIRVAMGDEFPDIETMTREISSLLNLAKDLSPLDNFARRASYMGNMINAMSASGSAFAPYIVDIMKRTLPTFQEYNITTQQTIALATTISELGFNPELGATALNTLLKRAAENMETFATFVQKADVGLTSQGFQKLFATDTYSALLKLLEALKKGGGDAIQIANLFKDLEVSGQGVSTVFTALSSNTDLLSSRLKVAEEAAGNTNSIMGEVMKMENTYAAQIARLQKNLAEKFAMPEIVEGYYSIIGMLADLTENTEKQSDSLEKQKNLVNLLTSELLLSETPLERRKEIEKELNAIAPQILKNLDWEAEKYETLRKNLEAYNKEQVHRITLARKEERIEKMRDEASNVYEKQEKLRQKFLKYLQDLDEKIAKGNESKSLPIFTGYIHTEGVVKPNFAQTARDYSNMSDAFESMRLSLDFLQNNFQNAETVKDDLAQIILESINADISFALKMEQIKNLEKNKVAFMKEMGLEPTPTLSTQPTITKNQSPILLKEEKVKKEKSNIEELEDWFMSIANQKPTDKLDLIKSYSLLVEKIRDAGETLLKENQITQDEYDMALSNAINQRTQAVLDYEKSVQEEKKRQAAEGLADLQKSVQQEEELRKFSQEMNLNWIREEKDRQRKEEEEAQKKHYEFLREQARKFYDDGKIDIEQFNVWMSAIDNRQKNEKLDKDKAEKKAARQKRADEIAETANAYGQLSSSIGSMFGSVSDFIDAAEIKNANLAKKLATFKIAAETATAIATNVALSVQAAAAGGPAAPFLIAGYVASGLATIFSAINQAKSILNQAPNVEAGSEPQRKPAVNVRKFGEGGYVNGKSHSNGGEMIEAEGGEYVARKSLVQNNLAEFKKIHQLSKNPNSRFFVVPKNQSFFVPKNSEISQIKNNQNLFNFNEIKQMIVANSLQINELKNIVMMSDNKEVVLSLRNLSEQNQKYLEITNQNLNTNGANRIDT